MEKVLESFAIMWNSSILLEKEISKTTRIPLSFPNIDKFGETICSCITGYHGNGGNGSGYDLSNGEAGIEVKTVSWIQPHKCTSCDRRTPYFCGDTCVHCNNSKLKLVKDSRAVIKANTHLKYIDTLKTYMIVLLEYDSKLNINIWRIESDNPYFDKYIRTQNEQESKDCNLLPRSYDFHMSGPTRVFQVSIEFPLDSPPLIGEVNMQHVKECVPKNILKSDEAKLFEQDIIPYEIACEKLSIRKKAHGRARGETKRII